MKAVVTGATGAVGMALLAELSEQGVETLVLCRKGSRRNDRIKESRYIKKVECSLDELESFALGTNEKYDVFYHFAWEGTTGSSRNDMPLQNRNVKYALDALALAARLGCNTFVGAGSQAEYGRVEGKLTPETPAFPENGYGIAKLCAGSMCRVSAEALGIRFVWARILSVYGPYDTENSMVMSTLKKIINRERPSFTAGEQIWDYLYSADAARALYLLGATETAKGIYCLGSGKPRPLKDYIIAIRNEADAEAEIGLGEIPYAPNQVMYLCADISKLTTDTGFVPKTDFADGIKKTAEWYKAEKN
ncbi:MAG: NAD(P)-dependent oxidoreductase [Ruminococcaceae bacterium]|nr:NAD(P)-dependent oxidoreductase [Oscillospiraceae bacterium]